MSIFNVPVTIQVSANSASEASELVSSFLTYAQDVGNDEGTVVANFVAAENEIKMSTAEGKIYMTEAEELEAGKQDFLKALPIIVGVSILAAILIPYFAKFVR